MMKPQSEENDSLVIGNFSATLSAGHAKDLLKGLESLGDQTIFTFSADKGLETGMVSNDVSTLIRCQLAPELFEEYTFVGDAPIKLGVVLERVKAVSYTHLTLPTIYSV